MWEFVKKGDPPVVGITKLGNGVTLESLKRARREVPLDVKNSLNPPKTASTSTSPAQ